MFSGLIQQYGNNLVKGGMRNLPLALAGYLQAHGGEIRTDARVDRILVEDGRAAAVRLADGDVIDVGQLVASNIDPQQLALRLLGDEVVGSKIADKMRRYELGESVLVIYLALDRPVHYKAGALVGRGLYVHPAAPSMDAHARQFQECRGGLLPSRPFALLCNDSAAEPGRAPAGKALMKLVVQPVPYRIQGDAGGTITGSTWQQVKESFADRVIEQLTADYIPDLRANIACRVVHSPVDLETLLPSTPQGTITHGAFLPYQIGAMRPIPEMGRYRSPVDNVYLCGSGSHPGAGVSMAPGRNAAQAIYRDLALAFDADFDIAARVDLPTEVPTSDELEAPVTDFRRGCGSTVHPSLDSLRPRRARCRAGCWARRCSSTSRGGECPLCQCDVVRTGWRRVIPRS